MANRAIASMELDDVTSISRRWAVTGTITVPATGLGNTGNVRFTPGSNPAILTTLEPNTEYHFGFRFIRESGTGLFTSNGYYALGIDPYGRLAIYTVGGVLVATTNTLLLPNVRYWIDWSTKIHSSTGYTKVYINAANSSATADATYTGNTGSSTISFFGFGFPGANITFRAQHFYANDSTGGFNDTIWGDTRIIACLPTGDGTTGLTPTSGSDHYLMVDDTTTDDDSTTVSGASGRDTFVFSALGVDASVIRSVAINLTARRNEPSALNLAGTLKTASTFYDATAKQPSTDYLVYQFVWEKNPNTSAAWAQAAVETAEYGVKVV